MTRLVFILTTFLFLGCSYTYECIQTTDGKTYRVRSYKDDSKQEKYENTLKFKNSYSKMSFSKYDKKILNGSFKEFIFFQFDSTRIYIDTTFKKYVSLFLSGVITPEMVFCASNNLCRPIQDSSSIWNKINDSTLYSTNKFEVFSGDFLTKRYNWSGNRISISNLKELTYLAKGNSRVFMIEHKIYYGGPTNNYYFLELTNDQASKKTNLDDFIKNAYVTFFKLTRITAEI